MLRVADGKLMLAAVEYIVPADRHGMTQEIPNCLYCMVTDFHLNENLGVYVLHAWIWKHNPAGMYEDWNPLVTCP
jgi:hypothetical protein